MDRKKVIKDLEECLSASCRGFRPRMSCPYNDDEWDIMRDALALLKEQKEKDEKILTALDGYRMCDEMSKNAYDNLTKLIQSKRGEGK